MSANPLGWCLDELESWVSARGFPGFHARQVAEWIFTAGVTDPMAMTNLPAPLRRELSQAAPPALPVRIAERRSADGTVKLLLRTRDGETIEMVIIPEGRRNTLCLSTQVGCPMGCRFCRTGAMGFVRNLTAAEIVGQVVLARCALGSGRALTNIVVMGMGEPLLNASSVVQALRIVSAPWGLAIPLRRITLSTAGVVPAIRSVREQLPGLNLAVSLNAPTTALRETIMPGTRPWPLKQLMAALADLPGASRHPVTLEYVLLAGVNDSPGCAAALAKLVAGRGMQVNLIPYNAYPGGEYAAPTADAADGFADILARSGVKALLRKSRGIDIEAACGQLKGDVIRDAGRGG